MQGGAPDHARGDRGQDDHPERFRRPLPKDQLHREEHPREWRIERGGDAAGGTARDQEPHASLVEMEELGERGPERRTDLDDRPLTADRSATTDAQGAGERLDDGHLRADPAAVPRDCQHHFGNAVAACLAGEPVDEGAVEDAGDDRGHDDEEAAESAHVRIRLTGHTGIVEVSGEHPRQAFDHVPERDRAESGAHTDDQRQRQQAQPEGAKTGEFRHCGDRHHVCIVQYLVCANQARLGRVQQVTFKERS